jgi:hypothetical protein
LYFNCVIVSWYGVFIQAANLSFETDECLTVGSRMDCRVVFLQTQYHRYKWSLVSTTEDNTLLCGKLFPLRVNSLPLLTVCSWEYCGLGKGYAPALRSLFFLVLVTDHMYFACFV